MGGPLAEQETVSELHTILDIACGPGGWVLDIAYELPGADVAGIDISETMIEYARARAKTQKITNASFEVMNILQPLDFSDNSFDLVNARFLVMVLSRTAWPGIIQECKRILRPGGILRLTEIDVLGLTTSPTFEKMNELAAQSLHRAGYGFSPTGKTFGMTPMLARLLQNAGFTQIANKAHVLPFSANTQGLTDVYQNMQAGFQLGIPILLKTGVATQEEVNKLREQLTIEMFADDFCGVWPYLTAWGRKPA
jgi:ubiquinone/menaquinone biosynthesis C-methylase UbiE